LKGKEHVIGVDSTQEMDVTKPEPIGSMTFDQNPSLATGGKAYEVYDRTTGQRTVREPVTQEPTV